MSWSLLLWMYYRFFQTNPSDGSALFTIHSSIQGWGFVIADGSISNPNIKLEGIVLLMTVFEPSWIFLKFQLEKSLSKRNGSFINLIQVETVISVSQSTCDFTVLFIFLNPLSWIFRKFPHHSDLCSWDWNSFEKKSITYTLSIFFQSPWIPIPLKLNWKKIDNVYVIDFFFNWVSIPWNTNRNGVEISEKFRIEPNEQNRKNLDWDTDTTVSTCIKLMKLNSRYVSTAIFRVTRSNLSGGVCVSLNYKNTQGFRQPWKNTSRQPCT